jgi:hypothetical protein
MRRPWGSCAADASRIWAAGEYGLEDLIEQLLTAVSGMGRCQR